MSSQTQTNHFHKIRKTQSNIKRNTSIKYLPNELLRGGSGLTLEMIVENSKLCSSNLLNFTNTTESKPFAVDIEKNRRHKSFSLPQQLVLDAAMVTKIEEEIKTTIDEVQLISLLQIVLNLTNLKKNSVLLSELTSVLIDRLEIHNSNTVLCWYLLTILEMTVGESGSSKLNYFRIEGCATDIVQKHKKLDSLQVLALRLLWINADKQTQTLPTCQETIKELNKILKGSNKSSKILVLCLQVVEKLSLHESSEEVFRQLGTIDNIMQLLSSSTELTVKHTAYSALRNLSFQKESKALIISRNYHIDLLESLERVTKDIMAAHVVSSGISVLWNIAETTENKMKIATEAVVDVIVNIMNTFRFHDRVQYESCGFFRALASSDTTRIMLMDREAGTKVLESMSDHIRSVHIQYQAFAVLKKLSCNDVNEGRLIKMGAGLKVMQSMEIHIKENIIVERACGLLWNLSVKESHKRLLIDIGCGEQIISAMNTHKNKETIQYQALRTVKRLARDGTNSIYLMRIGIAGHIIDAMKTYSLATGLQEKACGAIWNLSEADTHKKTLMKEGALYQIVQAMENHKESDALQYEAFGALRRLSVDNEVENELLSMNIVPFILETCARHINEISVQNQCLGLLWNLSHTGAERLMEAGAGKQIIESMKRHPVNEFVQEKGAGAFWKLATNRQQHRRQLFSLGAIEVLFEAISNNSKSFSLTHQAYGALWQLVLDDMCAERAFTLGGVDLAKATLKTCETDEKISLVIRGFLQTIENYQKSRTVEIVKVEVEKETKSNSEIPLALEVEDRPSKKSKFRRLAKKLHRSFCCTFRFQA